MAGKLGRQERYFKKSKGMAVNPSDWEQIQRSHDDTAGKVVEHQEHIENYRPADHYINMLSEEGIHSAQPFSGLHAGIGTKLIHDVPISEDEPDQTVRTMTKPYHAKIEPTSRSWVKSPIRGWATMATKALYNAGSIGHLAEDVAVHEHDGIPITVHTFASDFDTVQDLHTQSSKLGSPIQRFPDPLEIYQIATMDFLTGNVDRHGFNLMVSNKQTENGHHPLLAIDHDNNFQYHKSLAKMNGTNDRWTPERNIGDRTSDKPYDYMHLSSGLHQAHRAGYNNGWEDFHQWWMENSESIKHEFEKQIAYIKNKQIREHVSRNFHMRFDIIDRWAGDEDESNYANVDLFDKEFPYEAKINSVELANPELVDSIVEALPNDPIKAILTIAELYEGRSVSVKQKLRATYDRLISMLSGAQIVKLYDKALKDSSKKVEHVPLHLSLLFHVLKTNDLEQADALLDYEASGKPGKIPMSIKRKLRQI